MLGITPRDWLTYYPHFEEEGPELIRRIAEFYEENIKSKFSLKNCNACVIYLGFFYVLFCFSDTFDIIVPPHDNVLLVDFGPLNSKSNLYAFKWKEVQPIVIKVRILIVIRVILMLVCVYRTQKKQLLLYLDM